MTERGGEIMAESPRAAVAGGTGLELGGGSARDGAEALPGGLVPCERHLTLRNEHGLHARTATQFVQLAARYTSAIEVEKDGRVHDGKSVVGVLMLLADKGSGITVRARGEDAVQAVAALGELIEGRFGEQSG